MQILLFIIQASHNSVGSWDFYLIGYGLIIICDSGANIVRIYSTEFTGFLPRELC